MNPNSHAKLPPIRLPPIYSPSPSSPSTSTSTSHPQSQYNFSNRTPSQTPPPFIPSPPQHYNSTLSHKTEEYKTCLEQARLDQRRHEYALLRDALRRGVPYSAIPGLLASRDSSVRRDEGVGDYGRLGGGPTHGYSHESGLEHGHGQAGVIYYIPSPTDVHPIPPCKRRLDLDDSFLNRAYKRRKPWTGTGSTRAREGRKGAQQITFHHYVPGRK